MFEADDWFDMVDQDLHDEADNYYENMLPDLAGTSSDEDKYAAPSSEGDSSDNEGPHRMKTKYRTAWREAEAFAKVKYNCNKKQKEEAKTKRKRTSTLKPVGAYVASEHYDGAMEGYTFRTGHAGTGYYVDSGYSEGVTYIAAAPTCSEVPVFSWDLDSPTAPDSKNRRHV